MIEAVFMYHEIVSSQVKNCMIVLTKVWGFFQPSHILLHIAIVSITVFFKSVY